MQDAVEDLDRCNTKRNNRVTTKILVVKIFLLLPTLLLTGSNNLLNSAPDLPQSVISEHFTITPENLAKRGIPG